MKLGFGRVNIPHPGHVEYINQCDIFVLSSGAAKNKLPDVIRLKAIELIYPDLVTSGKVRIGRIKDYILSLGENDVVITTQENVSLPKGYKKHYVVVDKKDGLSSTKIRQYIDSHDDQALMEVYQNQYSIKVVKRLRELEIQGAG
jgi:hypothetical protein